MCLGLISQVNPLPGSRPLIPFLPLACHPPSLRSPTHLHQAGCLLSNQKLHAAGGADLADLQRRRREHHFFFFQNDTPTSTCSSEIAGERCGCHGNGGVHTNRSSTFLPGRAEQSLLASGTFRASLKTFLA